MKPRIGYFFWILMLAFGLMMLVVAAQLLTKRNINGLKKGNRDAVITFTINNRLQDLVNLCFELETKVTNTANLVPGRQSLTDSLTMLGYNASVLEQINLTEEVTTRFKKLNSFINQQIESSLEVLQNNGTARLKGIDTLRKMQIADSVYATALAIQKYLEKDLQATLSNNTEASTRLTAYNRTLAIIAITAVLILGTIIINRHLRQMQLISALEKATAAAQKLAMIKDQFLANMSHEIRTPLNAIKGFSRLIAQTPLSREQQQYTSIINDASGSLIHIVNDILDISKIEAGKLRIETKEFNLGKILQTVEHLFLNAAAEKQLEYSQFISENVPLHLKGDPERLSQILINLINNGIKFTSTGYVHTIVSLKKEGKDIVWIEFEIKDSGTGIPADKQEKIFQRFEQLDTGNDNITQGTGLGLSIVKSLTVLMGGSISVSSEYGKGSIFKAELPFEKTDVSFVDEKKMKPDIIPSYYYTGASVLVVEDNRVNQLLLKHTLASLDIAAEIVSNGQEALDATAKINFDLILMDIQMPVMDGYATMKAMRQHAQVKTPVVAMTAYAMPGEKEKVLAAGMNDYLAKPVDFEELVSLLEKYLRRGKEKKSAVVVSATAGDEFLLQLAGGDKNIARRILEQIKEEIPDTIAKLEAIKINNDFNELDKICHYMISTFSPMGNETIIMEKIHQLQNERHQANNNVVLITGLVHKLRELAQELNHKIESMG